MKMPVWLKPGLGGLLLDRHGHRWLLTTRMETAASADNIAQERADTAVAAALLLPFCVAKAQEDPEQPALAKFRAEKSSFSRYDLVIKAGWATFGVANAPDSALARACAAKLYAMKTN